MISDKKLLFVFSYTIMHRNNKRGQPVYVLHSAAGCERAVLTLAHKLRDRDLTFVRSCPFIHTAHNRKLTLTAAFSLLEILCLVQARVFFGWSVQGAGYMTANIVIWIPTDIKLTLSMGLGRIITA